MSKYQSKQGVPMPFTSTNIKRAAVNMTSENRPELPAPNGPFHVNEINRTAYAIIHHATFELTPREINFLGNMCSANALTPKQHKWLNDLAKLHLPKSSATAA